MKCFLIEMFFSWIEFLFMFTITTEEEERKVRLQQMVWTPRFYRKSDLGCVSAVHPASGLAVRCWYTCFSSGARQLRSTCDSSALLCGEMVAFPAQQCAMPANVLTSSAGCTIRRTASIAVALVLSKVGSARVFRTNRVKLLEGHSCDWFHRCRWRFVLLEPVGVIIPVLALKWTASAPENFACFTLCCLT